MKRFSYLLVKVQVRKKKTLQGTSRHKLLNVMGLACQDIAFIAAMV